MKTRPEPSHCTKRRIATVLIALGALFVAGGAHAVLGASASTIATDQTQLKAVGRVAAAAVSATVQSHELILADGSSIREYVNGAGIVFAVAWSTRFKPKLLPLLGEHAAGYAAAASAAMSKAGIQRRIVLEHDDLVVHASAHLNAHIGIAYLRSLVPEGVRVDDLR